MMGQQNQRSSYPNQQQQHQQPNPQFMQQQQQQNLKSRRTTASISELPGSVQGFLQVRNNLYGGVTICFEIFEATHPHFVFSVCFFSMIN
jgi:hypothetical protein